MTKHPKFTESHDSAARKSSSWISTGSRNTKNVGLNIIAIRKAASLLMFSAGKQKDVKLGIKAMRDMCIAGLRLRRQR